jgi:hypothetical protein
MKTLQNLSTAAMGALILLCITVLPSSVSGAEVIVEPTDDCEISMRNPDDNYGSSAGMHIRNRFGHPTHPTNWENDILIKFDLSSIPQSSPIISATLYIYYYYWTSNDPAGREWDLYRVTSDWEESTVTWNTRPDTAAQPTSYSIVPATTHTWMTWDVTNDVQVFADGEAINYGWKIMDTTTWGYFDIPYARCRTKEYDSCHPYLVVEYKADSLIIPSVTVAPCDSCWGGATPTVGVQPVAVKLKEPLLSACIPVEIPDGVRFCGISTEELVTEDWEVFLFWNQDSSAFAALMTPPGGLGDTLWDDTDSIIVFNILFSAQRECDTSFYIHWDTAFSDDPAHELVFTDTLGGARSPGFDPHRDSTEIEGYVPGDVQGDEVVQLSDATCLIAHLWDGNSSCICTWNAAEENGCGGAANLADFDYLWRYLYGGGPPPAPCGDSNGCTVSDGGIMSLDHVDGLFPSLDSNVQTGTPITFHMRVKNDVASTVRTISNGFRVYSPTGAQWGTTIPDTTGALGTSHFTDGITIHSFSIDGIDSDTVAFFGWIAGASGLPAGFDEVAYTIEIGPIDSVYDGRQICLDSAWYPPAGDWQWSAEPWSLSLYTPAWDGPHCFHIGCCIPPMRGNVDYGPGDVIDIADLVYLVDYMFNEGPEPPCFEEADMNCDGQIDIADLVHLVDYMFTGGPPPCRCDCADCPQ